MSLAEAPPTTEATLNLMGLIEPHEVFAIEVTIGVVDRLMIEMQGHRQHDPIRCKVWSEAGYDYLVATESTLRNIRDSHSRFFADVGRVEEADS